jgi:hypothetical protein
MPVTRRGSALLELLVALPLATMLAAAAAAMLVGVWRLARRGESQLAGTRELRHAHAALAADVRPLRARDLRDVRDTAIEFDAVLGVGVVCAASTRDRIDLLAADPDDAVGLAWAASVQPGDVVSLWHADPTGAPRPLNHATPLAGLSWSGGCGGAPWTAAWADRRAVRITLTVASPDLGMIGAPATVQRRVRYSLYRSGASWFLGRRTLTGGRWDTVQPVAGPLLSPAQGGMSVQALDRRSEPAVRLGDTAALRITLRLRWSPVGNAPPRPDSATMDIALRGEHAQRDR